MKLYLKWLAGVVGFICIVVVFQNCGKKASKDSGGSVTLDGQDAQQLISVMESSGIQDPAAIKSLSTPPTINLVAENMNCSRLTVGNGRECIFRVKKEDGTIKVVKTSSAATLAVINLLFVTGAKLTCSTNCNDVESYLVTAVTCTKNNEFPNQSTCTFSK